MTVEAGDDSAATKKQIVEADDAGATASPKLKQGRISNYFTSRMTPLRNAKKNVESETKSVGGLVAAASVDDLLEKSEPLPSPAVAATPMRKRKVPQKPKAKEEIAKEVAKEGSLLAEPVTIPAFERLSDLLLPGPSGRLRLPEALQLLQRIHGALESVIQLAADRDQPAIFHRIKKAAENIVGRDVTMDHLKQMNHLMPDAYTFRQTTTIQMGRRIPTVAIGFAGGKLGHAQLADRREAFHQALLDHVKTAHGILIDSIGVKLPEGAKLRSWHPSFDLESTPPIPVKELFSTPALPATENVKQGTPSQIREAISEAASEKKELPAKTPASVLPGKKLSLLERIKAKEMQAQAEQLVDRPKEASSESKTLCEFAENISFLFASASKGALPLGDITTKLSLGAKVPLAPSDIAARLHKLADLLPDWIQLVPMASSGIIVKLDRQQSMKTIAARLLK